MHGQPHIRFKLNKLNTHIPLTVIIHPLIFSIFYFKDWCRPIRAAYRTAFKWKDSRNETQEICFSTSYFPTDVVECF